MPEADSCCNKRTQSSVRPKLLEFFSFRSFLVSPTRTLSLLEVSGQTDQNIWRVESVPHFGLDFDYTNFSQSCSSETLDHKRGQKMKSTFA